MKRGLLFFQMTYRASLGILLLLLSAGQGYSAAISYTGASGGNWSLNTNWSAGNVPTNADDVTIPSGKSVIVDVAAVCGRLIIGSAAVSDASVIISGANTLDITTAGARSGDLTINPSNKAAKYLLSVMNGAVTVAGSLTGGAGTVANYGGSLGAFIEVAGGAIDFTSAGALTFPTGMFLAITGAGGSVSFGGAVTMGAGIAATAPQWYMTENGTITCAGLLTVNDADNHIDNNTVAGNFILNGGLTLGNGVGSASFVTMAGTYLSFGGNLTIGNTALVFNAGSTAEFTANATITPATGGITFGNITISGGTTTLAGNIIVFGDWYNTGATFTHGGFTVTFKGAANIIGGTSLTAFGPVVIFTGAAYTMDNSNSITTLSINSAAAGSAASLSLGASNPTLTISGAVTLFQPVNFITGLNINGGVCTIGGTLLFSCTLNNATDICQVLVTSGSLTTNGAVSFNDNQASNLIQIITVTGSGSVTFNSTVQNVAKAFFEYGTLSVTNNGSLIFTLGFDMRGGVLSVGPLGTLTFNKTGATAFKVTNTFSPSIITGSGSTLNFNGDVTITSYPTNPLVFANGSNSIFTDNSIVTPTTGLTFGNVTINAGKTLTLAGNVSVTGNWTNLAGTFTPSTNRVTFNGTGTQTITKAGSTEKFYDVTVNTTGPLTLESTTDVTITNRLTMTAGNINLNGKILQLGDGAVATLVYTAGTMYSNTGSFKRYVASGLNISSTLAPLYGLFPMGTSTDYRPVEINSTVAPTGSGYISVTHIEPPPPSYVIDVTYTDNELADIERIATLTSAVSTSGGFSGGAYDIYVQFSNLSNQGVLTDLKLETYTGAVMGSVGVSLPTAGTVGAPLGKRTGLTDLELANDFVIGTLDFLPTGTPLRQYYYSRRNGNWSDATIGDATWSYIAGGAGATCDCIPVNDGYAIVSDGQTVTVDVASIVDYLDVNNTSIVDGTGALTINKDLRTLGSGQIATTAGAWTISRDFLATGTGSSSLAGATSVGRNLNLGSGTTLTMTGGAGLTVTGDLILNGTLALGTSTLIMDGSAGKTISNSSASSITGAGGNVNITTASKTISAGTDITIEPTFTITGAITVTNLGTVTLTGNLSGSGGASTWTNSTNGVLNAAGTVLTTGVLNATAAPNIVNYNGAGAQTIKTPSASTYYHLKCSNAGIKSLAADIAASNMVTIVDAAILDEAVDLNDLTGAGLTMTGTSEFIVRNSLSNLTKPDLIGPYNLTGGTVTINSTVGGANWTAVRGATYYNLKLNGSNRYKMLSVFNITNDFIVDASVYFNDNSSLVVGGTTTYTSTATSTMADVLSTGSMVLNAGTLDCNDFDITVTSGDWTNNGGTFIPGAGTVIFNSVTTPQAINGTAVTQAFNNITVNNTGQILSGAGSTTTLDLTGNMLITAGTLAAGTATAINLSAGDWTNNGGVFTPGTGTVTFNSAAAPQAINGTAVSQTFNNITMNKAGQSLIPGGSTSTLNLNGNLLLSAGTFNIGTATAINVAGNWTNNATFTQGAGTVTLNGSAAQTISGTTTTTFNNFTLFNTSATGATLSQPIIVTGALTLTDGYLYSNYAPGTNIITLNDNATSTSGSANSFVSGQIKKIGNDAFVFPTGDDVTPAGFGAEDVWARLEISAPATATTQFTASYDYAKYSDVTMDITLMQVSYLEYWSLAEAVNADPVQVTLYWEDAARSHIVDYTTGDLVVARYNGVDFTSEGQGFISNSDPGFVRSNSPISVAGFDTKFTFGSVNGINPLPVELLSFDAKANGNIVDLSWSTASEFNSDYFIVERSKDGVSFEEFDNVNAAGNSTIIKNYGSEDTEPYSGISYYRLKMVDNDGKFSFTNMVAVEFDADDALSLFPNPATGPFNVNLKGNIGDEVLIVLTDILGKEFYSKVIVMSNEKEVIAIDPSGDIASGVYMIAASSNDNVYKKKIVIK